MTSRGLRNSNPLNIRKGDPWLGQTKEQPDPDFITFESPEYGIRAAAKLLLNYQEKFGCTTIRMIVSRWAPPSENDTEAYIRAVCAGVGIEPNQPIALRHAPNLCALIRAMCVHENGSCPYTDAEIYAGMKLAGIQPPPDFNNVQSGVETTAPKVNP
jgi:hypothetical protein